MDPEIEAPSPLLFLLETVLFPRAWNGETYKVPRDGQCTPPDCNSYLSHCCRVVSTYIDYCKLDRREPRIMVGRGVQRQQNSANLRESGPPNPMTDNHLSGWDGQQWALAAAKNSKSGPT